MTFPEFVKGMKKHFGITNGVQKFTDPLLFALTGEPKINIVRFNDWLYKKHGIYDNKKPVSMKEFIKEEYSQAACDFISSTI